MMIALLMAAAVAAQSPDTPVPNNVVLDVCFAALNAQPMTTDAMQAAKWARIRHYHLTNAQVLEVDRECLLIASYRVKQEFSGFRRRD